MAELLLGKPLFPGTDHIDQLTRIMGKVGTPSDELLAKIQSDEARNYIRSLPRMPKQDFRTIFTQASPQAVDLLEKMLHLDPDRRLDAPEALEHAYLRQYHDPDDEPEAPLLDQQALDLDRTVPEWKEELQQGSVTASETVRAYQWKAYEANQLTNCVTEFVTEAEEWAAELDTQDSKPPLFGIPFSVKESVGLKGYDLTRGYAQDLGIPQPEDALTVTALKQLGAIPFVRTNVPQTLLSFNCINPIFGKTTNPFAKDRTCGGSSGGEAALLALDGAPFGLGGDVGGSIRMPANYCGIAGLKPSHMRLSQIGSMGSVPGRPMLCASIGPMAKHVATIIAVMQELLSPVTFQLDPYVVPINFESNLLNGTTVADYSEVTKPLTIGYYDYDGWFPVTPAVSRAVQETKKVLESAGHKLVPWTPPKVPEAMSLFFASATVDEGRYILDRLSRDIEEPMQKSFYTSMRLPMCMKRFLGNVFGLFGSVRVQRFLHCFPRNTSELRLVYAAISQYRLEFTKLWKEANLDCVVCPSQVSPALPHDYPMKLTNTVSYTAIYNLLDFPAGVVPAIKVTSQDEKLTEETYETDDFQTRLVKKASVTGTEGLPVGVQCVALPYQEEVCLRLMKDVEQYMTKIISDD